MYGRPSSPEDRERRRNRPYRPDPRPQPEGNPLDRPAPNAEAGPERPHLAENELRYHGKNACLALLKARPQDIVRAYVLREKSEEFAELIEFCAKNHLSYHLVDAGDLERLTDSIHHQGVCLIARAKRFFREDAFFRELGAHRTLVIYLDGVANPHNLGAILRTAAHFGVKYVCVPKDEITKISPALYRTAEGGAELVHLVRVEDTEKFLDRLQSTGFQLYAFEPGAKAIPLFETRLNEKSVFVFGAEVEGLSGLVKTIVETKVTIPGTGGVESLNVSVAAAVAMAEFEKQSQSRSVRIVKNRP
jgi:TrmH RNA methyltransferase